MKNRNAVVRRKEQSGCVRRIQIGRKIMAYGIGIPKVLIKYIFKLQNNNFD